MPKLTLKFNDRIIKEYVVESEATIGRLPDNTVVIDNPAVSGHHARVFLDGDQVVVMHEPCGNLMQSSAAGICDLTVQSL